MDSDARVRQVMRGALVKKGWTQQRLADELGIGKSAVSQLLSGEYGKIPESLLRALDLLDLDLVAVPRRPRAPQLAEKPEK